MIGIVVLLFFGTWTLTAAVMALLVVFLPYRRLFRRPAVGLPQGEVQGWQINLARLLLLLVFSGAAAGVMVWATGGSVLVLALMSPGGITGSVLCCLLGLVLGTRKLLKARQRVLAGLWVVFLLPPLGISALGVADLTMFADVTVEQGSFTGSQTFHFGNFTSLIVKGDTVEYTFKHYNKRRGDMFHVPYDVLELQIDGQPHLVSDRSAGNQALSVDGKEYRVTAALRLDKTGTPVSDERK